VRTKSDPRPALVPVDINRATIAELETLPRIGPAIAARIVAEREANGPFASLAALEGRVRGIGPALARTIEPHVRF
jgi:competence protein ComEA